MTVLDDSDWSHKAWMSQRDADLFEDLLLDATEGRNARVLEWGAGKSTRYFTQLLRERGRSFRWTSLEYDRDFFKEDVAPWLESAPQSRVLWVDNAEFSWPADASACHEGQQAVDFVVFDYGKLQPMIPSGVADREVNMDPYVDGVLDLERGFDVILVDGRKRRRCLLNAKELVGDDGIVVLHDAQREYYHCAFDAYEFSQPCADILWLGARSRHQWIQERLEATGAAK